MAPTCRARRAPAQPPNLDLDQLAESLLDALDEPMSALLGVLDSSCGELELAVRRSGPDGPLAELLGWSTPSDWWAVGLVASATAHIVDERYEANVALLVDRGGGVACALRHDDGPARSLGPGGEGRLLDACRRALALPTPPPRRPVGELWAQCWLDRVVEALADGAVMGPAEATALHPLAPLLSATSPDLADLARNTVASTTWAELRELAADGLGRGLTPPVDPAVAAWMDDGMFARWCADAFPPSAELLEAVAELAPPALARHVARVVRAWDREPPGEDGADDLFR